MTGNKVHIDALRKIARLSKIPTYESLEQRIARLNTIAKKALYLTNTIERGREGSDSYETYLLERIADLKKSDIEACDKRWDISKLSTERSIWRDCSNQLTARRHELEEALKIYRNNREYHSSSERKSLSEDVVIVSDISPEKIREYKLPNISNYFKVKDL